MSEEYDLKKSEIKVGQLYPVIKDKFGKIIDGYHRKNVDSEWREEKLEWIDTREKYLKARIISNLHRRTVPPSEIKAWINELAKFALSERKIEPGRITKWIAEETGYAERTVREYLNEEYKIETRPKGIKMAPTAISVVSEAKEILGEEKYSKLAKTIIDDWEDQESFRPEDYGPFDPFEESIKRKELRDVGREIGKDFKDALIKLDEQIKKTPIKQEFLKNILGLKLILEQTESGEIFCPKHQGKFGSTVLVWDCCGDSVNDSIDYLEEQE